MLSLAHRWTGEGQTSKSAALARRRPIRWEGGQRDMLPIESAEHANAVCRLSVDGAARRCNKRSQRGLLHKHERTLFDTAPTRAELIAATGLRDGERFDEMVDAHGVIRPHWQPSPALRRLRPARSERSGGKAAPAASAKTASPRICSPTHGTDEPWKIDLIPLISRPRNGAAWRGVIQRARLFAAILGDIYGRQRLLARPHSAAARSRRPGFPAPAERHRAGAGGWPFYAADFARDADGRWRVIDNHTETLAGVGFALANRIVHSHVAGDLFRDSKALRLARSSSALQGELLARAGRDDAPIALLTPGAHHEDYFGHAYLARYLGLLLVEGGDLRIVGNRVYMKTLEGLQPIDLILRCVEGAQSRSPGARPGRLSRPRRLRAGDAATIPISCTNAVGTAIVENRGLGAVSARAVPRDVLGEDLAMPDQPRWWLGDPKNRAACARQPRPHRHPPGAGRHRAPGRRAVPAAIRRGMTTAERAR